VLAMETTTPELKYCLYARKSSEQDERQAMSIDSQLTEMKALAQSESLEIVKVLEESHSAKASGQREVYNELINGLKTGEYNAILTWAPDRLSRNAGDLGSLVDLMDQSKLLHIRTYSQMFSNNPNEKFLLMILCSQAKLENDNKSINIKRGIRTKCNMGWRPGAAPLGYMNRHFAGIKDIIPDPNRASVITEMYRKAGYDGWSGRRLKAWLDDEKGFTNRQGKPIALSQVFLILTNSFYHGSFEYPEGSGKWFVGAHEALVSKDLFDLVQEVRGIQRGVWGSKQFAYRGLLKCGHCGGDVTAEEKFKKLKAGGVNRHVYYRCTKKVDLHCPEKYINEQNLEVLLLDYAENNVDKLKFDNKLLSAAESHYKVAKSVADQYGIKLTESHPTVEYIRYVLVQGSFNDKANLTKHIHTNLRIKDGEILIH
jgi:site-specific DNA recombinase